jgi:hypothetical protein
MKELKKYKLRAARKPKKHPLLSGVVHVADWEGTGYAYVNFDESFVDAVGKALPHGLMPSAPAYLKVLHMPGRKSWRVFAFYLRELRGTLLWESPTRPAWVSKAIRD